MDLTDFLKNFAPEPEKFHAANVDLSDYFLDEIKSNPQACMFEEIPQGFGRFGLDETNPIPAFSIISNNDYLNRLRMLDGEQISYERKGSLETNNICKPIDMYEIFNLNGDFIVTRPTTYPLRNNKADRSLQILGYILNQYDFARKAKPQLMLEIDHTF